MLRFRNAVWGNESFRLRVVEERSLMLNLHKNCGEANPKPKPKPSLYPLLYRSSTLTLTLP